MTPDAFADPDVPAVPVTAVRLTGAATREALPLLVLGPAEGASALDLWADVAAGLDDAFDVLAWDLPGHGYNAPLPPGAEPLTVASLAAGVVRVVDDVLAQRGELGGACAWAGVGIGGEVARHLRDVDPARVLAALALDDVPHDERAAVLRRDLLDEDPDAAPPPALDDRWRALVALVAAAATGRPVEDAVRDARAAGLSDAQVQEALVQTAEAARPGREDDDR
jgi:pimeloyl-ACP methyl ester carboxylesterase